MSSKGFSEGLAAFDVISLLRREAGDPSKSKDWLPKDKQYLVTRKGMLLNFGASYSGPSCLNKDSPQQQQCVSHVTWLDVRSSIQQARK